MTYKVRYSIIEEGDNMKLFKFQDKKKRNYFEGWYFRFTDTSTNSNYAIIFAVTKNTNDPHSFIQIFDGVKNKSYYYRYAYNSFEFNSLKEVISIGENTLSVDSLRLETKDYKITCSINNHEYLAYYNNRQSAMGPLQHAPLECFQEIIYIEAKVTYQITDRKGMSNGTGKAYMEKTYGNNFPQKWIWAQSNHSENGSKFSFSVGLIPVLFFKAKGFFMVLKYNGHEERYASYNFSKTHIEELSDKTSKLTISKKSTRIELVVTSTNPIKLIGPKKNGVMDLDVFESITSTATIVIYKNDQLVFTDSYQNVGLELMYHK